MVTTDTPGAVDRLGGSGSHPAPDEELADGGRWAATALGVAATWSGLQLLVIAAVVGASRGILPPALSHLWYAAVTLAAVGVTLVAGGAPRPTTIRARIRHRGGAAYAGVAAGTAVLLGSLVTLGAPAASPTVVAVVAAAQVGLVGAWARWSVPGSPPAPTRRTVVSSLVVGLIVGHVALVPLLLPDAYPFAVYTMFSEPRLDPYSGERVVFIADEGTVDERELPRPASRLALLDLAHDEEIDDLRAIADTLAERHGAEQVTVYLERVQVAPPPAPPRLEVAARDELVVAGG